MPGRVQQADPGLFNQIRTLGGLSQLFFSRGKHPLKANQNHILDDIGPGFCRSPAHIILFKLYYRLAYLGLNLSFGHRAHFINLTYMLEASSSSTANWDWPNCRT